jgi:DNA mismatch repair protein MutH
MNDKKESVPYDKSSVDSIYGYALALTGKSLSEAVELPKDVVNVRNRGDLGRLVEKYYFEHTPPNNHEPDFEDAGLELKVTGVVKASDGLLKAKERLVLTNIDYELIASETWADNYFRHKCETMLILFYLYSKESSVIDQKFVLKPKIYEFLKLHEEVIRDDWLTIQKKVLAGKAHELSEGDTFYLKACRKGPGGPSEKGRKQPFSTELAKTRAFSLKQGFLTSIIEDHELEGGSILDGKSGNEADGTYNRLVAFQGDSKKEVALGVGKELTFEKAIESRFRPFIGLTVSEISTELNFFTSSKQEKWMLSKRILAHGGQAIEEFEKAEIQLKTVSLSKSGGCREDMSFPAFKCIEIASQDWEDSDFSYQVETKFLFVVFKADSNGEDRLEKVMYWNMPYEDRLEAKRVWEDAKCRVTIDARDLPKRKDSKVAHVRPHATNKKDVDLTPQGEWVVKRCFWLNGSYIAKIVS